MTTKANIVILGDVVFSVEHDGYPDSVLPYLQAKLKVSNTPKELIGELAVDSIEEGWIKLGGLAVIDYEYIIDFGTRTITYNEQQDDDNFVEKVVKF